MIETKSDQHLAHLASRDCSWSCAYCATPMAELVHEHQAFMASASILRKRALKRGLHVKADKAIPNHLRSCCLSMIVSAAAIHDCTVTCTEHPQVRHALQCFVWHLELQRWPYWAYLSCNAAPIPGHVEHLYTATAACNMVPSCQAGGVAAS